MEWYNRPMDPSIYDEFAIEETIKKDFGLHLDIQQIIATNLPTSHTTKAAVILTKKHALYVLITGHAPTTLGDVQKTIKKMGMVAADYCPPGHDKDYFSRVAEDKFRAVFPGRKPTGEHDIRFYRQLVPYHPALVRISEITDGIIRQFDAADSTDWRAAVKFAYRQITTIE